MPKTLERIPETIDIETPKDRQSAAAEPTSSNANEQKVVFKLIQTSSYWLGVTFAALALLSRVLDTVGRNFLDFETRGGGVGYHTFTNGMYFFLAISIATSLYAKTNSQKP